MKDTTNTNAHILIVDDEASIRYFLTETLTDAGYHVVSVDSGEAALAQIGARDFDLALLDLKLPGIGGIEILEKLRQTSQDTTVIVLTAHASLETAIEALRQGAHDYLFKPCEPEQLRASVQAGLLKRKRQLRHREVLGQLEQRIHENLDGILTSAFEQLIISPEEHPPTPEGANPQDILTYATLRIDLLRHKATLKGETLELSPTEFDLLTYLTQKAPRVVTPEELADEVLKYEGEPWDIGDILRTHIYRIRRKLKSVEENTDLIETVRGVGYRIQRA